MSVLVTSAELERRRREVAGPMRSLAESLAADLDPVIDRDLFIPPEKARLTRRGGRCEVDGVLLEFDPFSPRVHRCPSCGRVFDDESHYRWWVMGYQLWLAERAVHAAVLFALGGRERHRSFAIAVLDAYADLYLDYPNRDNVLGPTRLFFSTYLESIWLLQIIVALDLLEAAEGGGKSLGTTSATLRERVIAPSAALIAGYDEGLSNRQVWNNAALLAATRALGDRQADRLLHGPSGLMAHLTHGLLSDGTWYEGENYHLFAHRGLWYGVTIAASAGATLRRDLIGRFEEAFATPFVTALPDFTFPSRRDSQYRVSLRQWRFAELAELGLVRRPDDERLQGALATLYDDAIPRGDTGRWRATAEAERNGPASALARSDLGWRSLLFAAPELPTLGTPVPRSVLLREQGFAVLRRDAGRVYAALDYGHSGAGHGHPDRLNVLLVQDNVRWLDDVGTGSYVDPSLHWYRSTLAHNAPLVNGRSQARVHGALSAFEDRGAAGWVRATVQDIAPGVRMERALVAMPDYVVDELTWHADRDIAVDLPLHVDGALIGAGPWTAAAPSGGSDPEDGFSYLRQAETAPGVDGNVRLAARRDGNEAVAWVFVDGPHAWWRADSLGPPGEGSRRFHFVRASGRRGSIATVWDLTASIANAARADAVVTVDLADGSRHEHRGDVDGWHITLATSGSRSSIDLGGCVSAAAAPPVEKSARSHRRFVIPRGPAAGPPGTATATATAKAALAFELGENHYRRSELSWREAGSPTATVALGAFDDCLFITVDVQKRDVHFAPQCDSNPLDNEHPDTNSDGIQLHLVVPSPPAPGKGRTAKVDHSWLLVPEEGSRHVRVNERGAAGDGFSLHAMWKRTSRGYRVYCQLEVAALGDSPRLPFLLDVIVNDMSPDRERRRGQLVLGGANGEFVYLRGDRHDADRHFEFVVADE